MIGALPSTAPRPSSTDDDGGEWTPLSLLGLRFRWADPTGGVTEVLERTKDEFSVGSRILRDTIDAIRPLAEDVCEKQHALTELLRISGPHPDAIDTLTLAINERHEQIDRLARFFLGTRLNGRPAALLGRAARLACGAREPRGAPSRMAGSRAT